MPLRVHVAFLTAIALSSVLAVMVLAREFVPEPERPDPTVALRYDIDAVVDDDGVMEVVETFRYDFDRDRVQLKRSFSASALVPTDWKILRDGKPEPFTFGPERSGHLLVVGDGDGEPSGRGVHEYRFRYRVAGVLPGRPGESRPFGQELVSSRYSVRVLAGRVRVTFPTRAMTATCTFGSGAPCRVEGVGGRRVTVELGALAPYTGMVLDVGLAPSTPGPGRIP